MGCDEGGGFKDSKWEGRGQHHARWEVDLQHGTGMEENSHSCIKGHYTKKAFFHLETHMFKSLYIVQYFIDTVYFSPLQVKNKR